MSIFLLFMDLNKTFKKSYSTVIPIICIVSNFIWNLFLYSVVLPTGQDMESLWIQILSSRQQQINTRFL